MPRRNSAAFPSFSTNSGHSAQKPFSASAVEKSTHFLPSFPQLVGKPVETPDFSMIFRGFPQGKPLFSVENSLDISRHFFLRLSFYRICGNFKKALDRLFGEKLCIFHETGKIRTKNRKAARSSVCDPGGVNHRTGTSRLPYQYMLFSFIYTQSFIISPQSLFSATRFD